jgi:hypothetical protein
MKWEPDRKIKQESPPSAVSFGTSLPVSAGYDVVTPVYE